MNKKVIFVYYLCFAVATWLLAPPFEAPDEPAHLQYINFVAQRLELPNQLEPDSRIPGEGNQHPLYYMLCGGILRLFSHDHRIETNLSWNKLHPIGGGDSTARVPVYNRYDKFPSTGDKIGFYGLRLISILMGFVTLIFIWKSGELFFQNENFRIIPALMVATLPQFVFMSSVINNDNLANMFAAITCYYAFRAVKNPVAIREYLLTGLFCGLALAAKKTTLYLLPGIGLLIVIIAVRERSRILLIIRNGLVMIAAFVLASGWVLMRNKLLYGDFLGTGLETIEFNRLDEVKSIFSIGFWIPFIPRMGLSALSNPGWMNVRLPYSFYLFPMLLYATSGCAVLFYFTKNRFRDVQLGYSLLLALLCLMGIVYFNMTYLQHQGRWLFPALVPLVMIAAVGYSQIIKWLGSVSKQKIIFGITIAGLVLFDLFHLAWIGWFFYRTGQYGI